MSQPLTLGSLTATNLFNYCSNQNIYISILLFFYADNVLMIVLIFFPDLSLNVLINKVLTQRNECREGEKKKQRQVRGENSRKSVRWSAVPVAPK